MRYCPNCGIQLNAEVNFCHSCGAAQRTENPEESGPENLGKVLVRAKHRRCLPGAFAAVLKTGDEAPWAAAQQDAWLDEDSEEVHHAGEEFNASIRPSPTTWIPTDCAWAVHLPPRRLQGAPTGQLTKRFDAIGTVSGHTFSDLQRWLGPPHMSVSNGDGTIRTWTSGGLFSTMSVAVVFDRYDICLGIASQVSF